VAERLGLAAAIAAADAVVTGEGKLDAGSFNGKVVGGVLGLARRAGRPALVVAGTIDDPVDEALPAVSLSERFGTAAAWGEPLRCVAEATEEWLRRGPAS
jgi:glycerate kinase